MAASPRRPERPVVPLAGEDLNCRGDLWLVLGDPVREPAPCWAQGEGPGASPRRTGLGGPAPWGLFLAPKWPVPFWLAGRGSLQRWPHPQPSGKPFLRPVRGLPGQPESREGHVSHAYRLTSEPFPLSYLACRSVWPLTFMLRCVLIVLVRLINV